MSEINTDAREVGQRLENALKGIAPDIEENLKNSLLSEEATVSKRKDLIMFENKKKNWTRYIAVAAAVAVVAVACLVGGGRYKASHRVNAVVTLDVNPSIEIKVNSQEEVLSVTPLNEDAEDIVGTMKFEGSDLELTVNALLGSMLQKGYISDIANSLLITVSGNNDAESQALQARLTEKAEEILEASKVNGAILSQTLAADGDTKLQEASEQYGISQGKAQLIDEITKQNTLYTFEELVPLTINELNLISESGTTKLESVSSTGTASDSSYIGQAKAKEIALADANADENSIAYLEIELDWENGHMVYEVDFDYDRMEYSYEINATTGAIEDREKEQDDDYFQEQAKVEEKTEEKSSADKTGSYIGEAAAKKAALEHAGVEASSISDYECEFDHERGKVVYSIDFDSKGYEYEYDIDALTGAVIKYEKEKSDDNKKDTSGDSGKTSGTEETKETYIGEAAAKKAALAHAGIEASSISDYECELEKEDGKMVYEISFDANGYEYDYEIDAVSGSIIKSEKEKD